MSGLSRHTATASADLEDRLAEAEVRINVMGAVLESLASRISNLENGRQAHAATEADDSQLESEQGISAVASSELPRILTVKSLERYFLSQGFEVKNNRTRSANGGGLWVYASESALRPLVALLNDRGIAARFYGAGYRSRDPRPSWEIDPLKHLKVGR